MRTDPTETGGLFVGRRPGTSPLRFRTLPVLGSALRQQMDAGFADALLAAMIALCVLCWGPVPILCLWVGSQIDYVTGSMMLGIFMSFVTLLGALLVVLAVLTRLDRAWILVRRAAGHDQRRGALGRVFAVSAVLGATGFTIWFLIIHGPGSTLFSGQSGL